MTSFRNSERCLDFARHDRKKTETPHFFRHRQHANQYRRSGCGSFKAREQKTLRDRSRVTGIEIAGRTDSGIVRQMLAKHGVEPTDEELHRFFDSLS